MGHCATVSLLLERGADPLARNNVSKNWKFFTVRSTIKKHGQFSTYTSPPLLCSVCLSIIYLYNCPKMFNSIYRLFCFCWIITFSTCQSIFYISFCNCPLQTGKLPGDLAKEEVKQLLETWRLSSSQVRSDILYRIGIGIGMVVNTKFFFGKMLLEICGFERLFGFHHRGGVFCGQWAAGDRVALSELLRQQGLYE